MKADLVLHGARVLTLNPRRPRAGAVAIRAGRILWVGEDIESVREGARKAIDCEGKALLPAFIDAHFHLFAYASSLISLDCSPVSVASIAQIKERVRRRVREIPTGSWVRASGYDEFSLAEKRHPTRWDLDEAAPHHPVRLLHRSLHACVLNSLALSRAGITRETPDPIEGLIDRDETGEPTGLLFGMNPYLTEKVIPPLSDAELRWGMERASRQLLSWGITSIQDATAGNSLYQWETLRKLKREGRFAPRVTMMIGFSSLEDFLRAGYTFGSGDEDLRLGAVKIVLEETTGSLTPPREVLREQVVQTHRAGFQVALHAVEETTLEAAVEALEHALRLYPRPDHRPSMDSGHRHRIEHGSVCPPPLLRRLRALKVVVVTQPPFLYYSGDRYRTEVPPHQQPWLYRIKSFQRAGLRPAASSDAPVVPPNPMIGLYAAVTRRSQEGVALLPEEAISSQEALEMYTRSAAYAAFEEGAKGSLAAGKLADLVLLSHDPSAVPLDDIKDIRVEKTILGGRVFSEAGEEAA